MLCGLVPSYCAETGPRGGARPSCAWFGHALRAARSEGTPACEEARLLADRAATHLELGRFVDAAADCEVAVEKDPSLASAHVRGAAALLHLGRMADAERFATTAVRASQPPLDARHESLAQLRLLSVRELRTRLRRLRVANAANESVAAAPLEKEELVQSIESLERAAETTSTPALLAEQAMAEVCAMRDRVDELELMARRGEWTQVVEHAAWLMQDYPLHSALRQLRLTALASLSKFDAAAELCDEMLQRTPDDADVLHFHAWLAFQQGGALTAHNVLKEFQLHEVQHAASAELNGLVIAFQRAHELAQQSFHRGEHFAALTCSCEALALSEGSNAARLPVLVLMASALAKQERHLEAVSSCDLGLSLLPWASGTAHQTREQERLLMRRAGCFLVLGQPAQALSDYRSAFNLNPRSAQAAAGVREAWCALQSTHAHDSLYDVIGARQDASDEALRRAYRKLALRWHPDKHAQSDGATRAEADARFRRLQDAWAVLSVAESRAAYDAELNKNSAGL